MLPRFRPPTLVVWCREDVVTQLSWGETTRAPKRVAAADKRSSEAAFAAMVVCCSQLTFGDLEERRQTTVPGGKQLPKQLPNCCARRERRLFRHNAESLARFTYSGAAKAVGAADGTSADRISGYRLGTITERLTLAAVGIVRKLADDETRQPDASGAGDGVSIAVVDLLAADALVTYADEAATDECLSFAARTGAMITRLAAIGEDGQESD